MARATDPNTVTTRLRYPRTAAPVLWLYLAAAGTPARYRFCSRERPVPACAVKRRRLPDLLAPVYGWFRDGFDTSDLREAKALLDDLIVNSTRVRSRQVLNPSRR